MADPVEIILDFLQRHDFGKAEAAFKEELLARNRGEKPVLSSENVLDWDLQLRSRVPHDMDCVSQDFDRLTITPANEAAALSIPDGSSLQVFSTEKEDTEGILSERTRSPPEKQLYVEYESKESKTQDSRGMVLQDRAFENYRTSPESHSLVGAYAAPIYKDKTKGEGSIWIDSFHQLEGSSPGMPGVSLPLPAIKQAREGDATLDEQALTWDDGPILRQQQSSVQDQGQRSSKNESQRKVERRCGESGIMSSAYSSEIVQNHSKDIGNHELQSLKFILPGEAEGTNEKMDEGEDISLRLKNGFILSSNTKSSFKDPALTTFFPLSFLKPQQSLVAESANRNDEQTVGGFSWSHGKPQTYEIRNPVVESRVTEHMPQAENKDFSANSVCDPEMLPRLPPVRIHSIEKNLDLFKEGGSAGDNENSTRSFESTGFRSIASTPEGAFGWGVLADGLSSHDVPISGLKRPVSRPSVSQGIVEDMSEQLSGLATAIDERWYPEEYCDSDTWEDDDDPGYHRQPIEDEEWFLAHEIDYPSEDDRARQHADKNPEAEAKQSKKLDEDDASFVEEESYFSGEEYYRQQAAKKESHKLQQLELKGQVTQAQGTYEFVYSISNDNDVSPMSRGDDQGNYSDRKELSSQPVWKGFMYKPNELDQAVNGFKLESLERCQAEGVDDDNRGSVRSGGLVVSSDAAGVGSEVRDSVLGASSEGDAESFRDQGFTSFGPSHGKSNSQGYLSTKEGRHVEVKSAPVRHLDEDEDDHDVVLQYYSQEWGHSKRSSDKEASGRSAYEIGVPTKESSKGKHSINCSNDAGQDNGGFAFEGFSFPSPSSTGDIAGSRAGSGKSVWSNRESTVQGEETDGYGSGMVGPDNTLAAWKRKSNDSSPVIGSSEDNLSNLNLSNRSMGSLHSTDEYVSLEAREEGLEDSDVGGLDTADPLPKVTQSQLSAQEEEDAVLAQDEMRTLGAYDDQYEVFDLRIIHRKNRTGFEEDKDFHVMINSVIAGRYHVTEYLGSAAFSKAIQAHDLQTGMDVCMKIIKNNKDFFDQSLDEIKLLKFVNKHDPADKYHILRLYDYFYHREHLFIVCELLRANLYEFHKFNRESGGEVYFTMPRLQSITLQCLEALEFLHRLGIIHCDLKPENILVKSYSRCEIKIIDLGSSCFQTDHLCSYVQSRSYRAPEVILGLSYDQKIDIWSLGCILAELCTGNVLFQNDSLATLLARVVGILGPIDPEVLAKGRDTHKYFTKNHMLYERNQETDQLEYLLPKRTSLSHRLPMGDQGFVEFVGFLLQNNPAKRPSASEALRHPWLSYPYEPISS